MGRPVIIPIPCPGLGELGIQIAFYHLNDILANGRKELPAMERPSSHHVQVFGVWVLADDWVLGWCDCIPGAGQNADSWATGWTLPPRVYWTHQQIR